MTRRSLFLLSLLGLLVALGVASFQPYPGYLDAAYYFGGGLQLARGRGFTEPYIWSYLDDPAGLPHPSHGYWQPLASIFSALGLILTQRQSYAAARLTFILLSVLIPPLTARLAFSFTSRRDLALTSGVIAAFSGYYVPFLPVTDNFSPYIVLGALYFLVLGLEKRSFLGALRHFFILGLLAGLFHLARSDGLLWLGLTWLAAGLWGRRSGFSIPRLLGLVLVAFAGYLLVMTPWYLRNLSVYGALFSPASSRALWLRLYNETFIYPPQQLTPEHLLALGWLPILQARLWALWQNLQTAFAAQGAILLFPFVWVASWLRREDLRVQIGAIAWGMLYLAFSLLFPFAGVRGGFFHAGAALLPLWAALAPLGLERVIAWLGARRRWNLAQAQPFFRIALVEILLLLTLYVTWTRLVRLGWGEGEQYYPAVEQALQAHGIRPGEPVMVLNPPAYYITTGRPAIVQPYGDAEIVLQVARRYGVRFLLLEPDSTSLPLGDPSQHPAFRYFGEVEGVRLFEMGE